MQPKSLTIIRPGEWYDASEVVRIVELAGADFGKAAKTRADYMRLIGRIEQLALDYNGVALKHRLEALDMGNNLTTLYDKLLDAYDLIGFPIPTKAKPVHEVYLAFRDGIRRATRTEKDTDFDKGKSLRDAVKQSVSLSDAMQDMELKANGGRPHGMGDARKRLAQRVRQVWLDKNVSQPEIYDLVQRELIEGVAANGPDEALIREELDAFRSRRIPPDDQRAKGKFISELINDFRAERKFVRQN